MASIQANHTPFCHTTHGIALVVTHIEAQEVDCWPSITLSYISRRYLAMDGAEFNLIGVFFGAGFKLNQNGAQRVNVSAEIA